MEDRNIGRVRQASIYIGGMSGQKPVAPIDMKALEARAREAMSHEAFAYVAGGAGLESTMMENREAFERWHIVPRMLRDVSERDTRVELFGRTLPSPFLLAPIGVLEMAHEDADLAVARAAAKHQVPMIFSNQASVCMEDCAAQMGKAPRWFQLYWSASNELVESLVKRAERAGCEAIVVTLDTTLLGWRVRDLDVAYLPFLRGKGIAQYVTDPVFKEILKNPPASDEMSSKRTLNLATVKSLIELVDAYPESFWKNLTSGEPLAAVRTFIRIYSRPSLTWEDLAFLRERTKLPILLKGVQHVDDARMAIDHGIDGLIVSNHGGRQVDGAVGSLDALAAISEAVGDRLTLLFDSGIRGGADAFKALALGAKAVCIGRPYVYALACAGEQGVDEILQNFKADFDLTMGLSGCRSIAEITRSTLQRRA
jgi:lactate 2-monooxygenase